MDINSERMTSLLNGVKIDLGIITSTVYDERLKQYILSSCSEMEREGATLDDSVEVNQLIIAFTSWKWRRRDTQEAMPRALRYSINNLIFSQKMRGD